MQRAVTLDQITQQNTQNTVVYRRQEGPKRSKGTLRPILDLCNFFKSQCHHKKKEGGCKEIQV
jgi:hypothetical protein